MEMYRPQLPFKEGYVEIDGEYVEVITPEKQADYDRDLMLADLEYRLLLAEFNAMTLTMATTTK